MPGPETKTLRDEIAKLHGTVSKVLAQNADLASQNADLMARVRALEARIAYENPHSPPSRGSIPSQQRKRAGSAGGSSGSPAPPGAGRCSQPRTHILPCSPAWDRPTPGQGRLRGSIPSRSNARFYM